MSPDQWLASQTEEKPAAALSPDQWLAQQQPAEKEPTRLSPDQWLAQQPVEAKTSNPFKGLVGRAASLAGEGVEAVARVVLEYPGEDGVLVRVIVRATRELVEAHQVLKIGQLAPLPALLQLMQLLAEAPSPAVAVAVLEHALLLDPAAYARAQSL